MYEKRRIILAVLLMLSIGNFSRMAGSGNVRTVEFLTIFVIGALSGLLINEFVPLFKSKEK